MARRRPVIDAEAERRSFERRTRIGGDVKAMRLRRGWSQKQLGDHCGIGRMDISRIERGASHLDIEQLERLSIALGVPLNVGFARDPRLETADAGHLAMQELVIRLGRASGYKPDFELPTKLAEPWRSVDVVLRAEARRTMICIECWNVIGDIGAAARSSARKAAEVDALATGFWGEGVRAALVWMVRATARNRALVARYPEVFASHFRGSSQQWVAALTAGAAPPNEPGLVWCDLSATRVWAWRRSGVST
jgi:transcriptional regulator with XRE-family HTH domain